MTKYTEKSIRFILAHPILSSIAATLVIITGIWGALGISVSNSLESWFNSNDKKLAEYNDFIETFGSEQFILVILDRPDPYCKSALKSDSELAARFRNIDGIADVLCLSGILDEAKIDEADARRYFANLELFNRMLIADDGKSCALFLLLESDIRARRRQIVENVDTVLRESGLKYYITGPTPVNVEINRMTRRESLALMPAMFLVSALILLLVFRRAGGVILPLFGALVSVAATLFVFHLAAQSMNLVTLMIPPLVFFLSLSAGIHILSAVRRRLGGESDLKTVVTSACAEVGTPCFFACITTAAGFLSLTVSPLLPIRNLGIFGAAGIMISFFAVFLVVPLGYSVFGRIRWFGLTPAKPSTGRVNVPRRAVRATAIVLAILIGIGSVCSLSMITVDSNSLSYIPDDSPIVVAAMKAADHFSGGTTCEIVLRLRKPFDDPESIAAVEGLQNFLNSRGEVQKTCSYLDLAKTAHYTVKEYEPSSYIIPDSPADRLMLFTFLKSNLTAWSSYVTADGRTVRIQSFAHTFSSKKYQAMLDDINERLDNLGPAVASAGVTGGVPLLVETQRYITQTQIYSFSIAFGVIALVMLVRFRSIRIVLISLAPNLLPILVALGLIKVIGASLNAATVLVAGIALGIAVDDTIHFLERYRRGRAAGKSTSDSISLTFATVRRPMTITTLAACAGFAVFCVSAFTPIFYFGILTSAAMGAALLADLYLLPALLLIFDRKRGKKKGA